MTRILTALLLTALSFVAHADDLRLSAYGVAKTFDFRILAADGTFVTNATDGGTDVTLTCDDGTPATATNDFVDEGSHYSIALTATELQCARLVVDVADATPNGFIIETYGNASAQHVAFAANVTQYGGTNGTFSGGRPEVNTTHAAGTAWNSGAIGANTLAADTITAAKAAADLTTELQAGLATSSSLTTVGTNVSTLLEALVVLGAEQTADSGTTTTLVDAALTQATDGWFNGMAVHFTSGTLLGQASCVTGFTAASDTVTFSPAVTTAVTTHTYYLLPDAECATGDPFARLGAPAGASVSADVADVRADIPSALVSGRMDVSVGAYQTGLTPLQPTVAGRTLDVSTGGEAGLDWANIGSPTTSVNLSGTTIATSQAVASVSGAVGSVTGNVGGNVTGSVGSIATGGITEASFATTAGSIDALGISRQGTAQGATSTTVTLDTSAPFGDNTNIGSTLWVKGSTAGNYWQPCLVSGYVASTKVATVSCASGFVTPTGTITYKQFGTATSTGGGLDAAGVRAAVGLASANLDTQLSTIDDFVDTEVAAIKTKTDFLPSATAGAAGGLFIAGSNAATSITTALTANITGNLSGSAGSVTGAVGSVTGNVGGNVTGSVGSVVNLEQIARADAAVINCTVNTAFFAGSTTTVACILTDRDAGAITAASNDLEGRELLILSGAQIYEGRFITDTTWDAANSELRLTLSRALPGTLADAVTAIIR